MNDETADATAAASAIGLPHSGFDTRGMAPEEAVAFWLETISVLFDVRLRDRTGENFHARSDVFMMGDLMLGTVSSSAQTFDRSRFRIGRDGLDHYLVQFYTGGSIGPRDGGPEEWTQPGDLWICDLAQTQASAATDFQNLNLLAPRRLLAPLLNAPDDHNMRRIRGDGALTGLLRSHMEALLRAAPVLTAEHAQAAIQPTLALVAATINGAAGDAVRGGADTSVHAALKRHVRARLYDPNLSAERVAGAFGISVRKLYYLFERSGGFTAHVQRERLRDISRALTDPLQDGLSIAEIADTHGFANAKSFSRAFRREFGVTAREMRGLAAGRKEHGPDADAGPDWWNWIEHLR